MNSEAPAPAPPSMVPQESVDPVVTNVVPWTDVVTALSSVVTAVATVGLVIGAVYAGSIALQTLKQMKKDSAAQTRPYLHAEISYSIAGQKAWDLIIHNSGRSAARKLTADLEYWPVGPADQIIQDTWHLLRTPRVLPPDTSVRTLWYMGPRLEYTAAESADGFIRSNVIKLSYEDGNGVSYSESFELDLDSLRMTPGPAEGVTWSNATHQDKKMSDIVRAINALRYRQ